MRYDPEHDLQIEKEYVAPIKPPSSKCTATSEAMEERVIVLVEKDKNGWEKSLEVLNFQLDGISHMSVLRMLKKKGIMHKNLHRSQFSTRIKRKLDSNLLSVIDIGF